MKSSSFLLRTLSFPSAFLWRPLDAIVRRFSKIGSPNNNIRYVENGKSFVTFRSRAIFSQKIDRLSRFETNPDTAIILQGPIMKKFSFTLESVKLYGQIFPDSPLIVSTWTTERKESIQELQKWGAQVVLTQPPVTSGIGSHNLQMFSSNAGLMFAQSLGSSFALKTRSDQRIHNPNSIKMMKRLLELFPLRETDEPQKARIVATSFSSFAYRLFGLSDMLHFGRTDDLLQFWDGSEDIRDGFEDLGTPSPSSRQVVKQNVAETYFMTNFLKRTGWSIEWTLENYWSACADRFVIVDSGSLDLFWPKYSTQEDRWKDYRYPFTHQELDMAFWLSLIDRSTSEDQILDLPEKNLGFPLAREANVARYSNKALPKN